VPSVRFRDYALGVADTRAGLDPAELKEALLNWSDRVQEATRAQGLSIQELAVQAGIPRTRLYGWLNGTNAPNPWHLAKIAQAIALPVSEQMRILGWLGDESRADALPADPVDLRFAAQRVTQVIEHLAVLEEHPAALVALALLTGAAEGETNRWEVRLGSETSGERYLFPAGLYAEFALRGVDPLPWPELETRYGDYLAGAASHFGPRETDPPEVDQIKRERVELRGRLMNSASASWGTWVGEGGYRWKSLALSGRERTHLFLPFDYRRSRPVSAAPAVLARADSRPPIRSIACLGVRYGQTDLAASLVARALGWAFINVAQRTSELYGRPALLGQPKRQPQMVSVATALLSSPDLAARNAVLDLSRSDVLADAEVLELLATSSEPFVVYVRPSRELMRLWEERQHDNIGLAGIEVSQFNRAAQLGESSRLVEAALRRRDSNSYLAFELAPDSERLQRESERHYEPPELSDWAMRIAWNVLEQLTSDPILSPTIDQQSPLASFAHDLAADPEREGTQLHRIDLAGA
jgi:transcriptional regulator with XRE-family HTH domain